MGWLAVACVNQALVALRSGDAEPTVELLHHAWDLGQLSALGFVSCFVVAAVRALLARMHVRGSIVRWHVLGLAAATFAVSLLIVGPDVRNAAGRYGLPVWLCTLAGATFFAMILGATALFRLVRWRARRAIAVALGLSAAVSNGFVLLGGYPAIHFMLAWFAASLFAIAAEGAVPRSPVEGSRRWVLLGMGATLSVASIVVPPRQQILVRMYGISSSVVVPFASAFYPKSEQFELAHVRREVLASPWFQKRENAAAVPATGSIRVSKPRVVLILVDTLRYDVVSEAKYLGRMPAFRKLHDSGARFTSARAPATWTRASIGALLTGRTFSQLHWGSLDGRPHLIDTTPRFAELLSNAGVATTMIPFFAFLGASSGIGKGFQSQVDGRHDANVVVDTVIERLQASRGPSFIYAHISEPHAPYRGKGTRFERYVQDVELVDAALQRLLDFLGGSKLARNTIVIVTADHGESFGEHGTYFHARNVYEELAHVPLLVFGPKVVARAIATPVAVIDVAPTILDLFGLPAPGLYMGQSLAPLLAGKDRKLDRPIAVHAGGMQGLYFPDGLKVIFGLVRGTVEVYDLAADPEERNNLIDSGRADVRSAVETARLFFHVHQAPPDTKGAESQEDPQVE